MALVCGFHEVGCSYVAATENSDNFRSVSLADLLLPFFNPIGNCIVCVDALRGDVIEFRWGYRKLLEIEKSRASKLYAFQEKEWSNNQRAPWLTLQTSIVGTAVADAGPRSARSGGACSGCLLRSAASTSGVAPCTPAEVSALHAFD